ncbi:DUF1302 domain-containing protein [Aquipseudomonas ullengensis]|uniref:DUF1302 domain-containing protein n=1 Tax=Aquipseudomonas ullengensis TaxID=2759166 RepID=A0A7W4LPR3_9GAMM|nr:DUF1302 domain-containing protein [Pseudomonas ullengensis]MBB2497106.1 DUF1302 domain-containing protein [Pseudomonas ullengensis]
MTRKTMRGVLQPSVLAVAVAVGVSTQAYAIDFKIGEIEGDFDSSLSVGASWAVRSADPAFISNFNPMGKRGGSSSRTVDDNRLNFKKGETFSKIFKGTHDLELRYGDSGAFVRGKYWYDFELKDENRLFYDIDDSGRDRSAQSSGAEFLDAFVYHNYTIDDLAGNVRLGKQVVSWGESTFIGNSINSINPVDVAALRRPGAEVKEGLIPVNMFYLSQGLSENVTAEVFYQLEWDNSVLDNCGTFFGNDGVPAGCDDRLVITGPDLAPGVANNTGLAEVRAGLDNAYIPRLEDDEARDSGQYGLALRWFVPELNETEFGAYAMSYHSRNPYLSLNATTVAPYVANPALPAALNETLAGVNGLARIRGARYFVDYPEDIHLYGLSFQTNIGGTSLGGEVSYRPNMPLQINTADLNLAALNQQGLLAPGVVGGMSPVFTTGHSVNAPGSEISGYERMPVFQAQMTATQFFDQVMGASRLTLVGEVGYNHINGLGDTDGTDLRFGRSPAFGAGEFPGVNNGVCIGTNAGLPTASNPAQECSDKGFYTSSSWGYRARARLDYNNVIAGINLSPNMAWSHDVDGYGPNFEEGNKAISVGLDADFLNTYTASLSYTDFFGGDFNTNIDRDFVALSFGVNF